MSNGETAARLLRRARLSSGMTLEDLAARSGVSVRGLGDIERGVRRMPRQSTLRAIAQALELDAATTTSLFAARTDAGTESPTLAAAPNRIGDFAGRAAELDEMTAAMAQPGALILVTGPAGFGKTTFAMEAAARRNESTSTVFVDLGGYGLRPLSPLEVLQQIVRQADPDGRDLPSTLDEAAGRWSVLAQARRVIVVLDNVSDEDQVRPAFAPNERGPVIVTSRRALAGLTATKRVVLDSLEDESSAALVRSIVPAAQRDGESVRELVVLCQGVPLALRIAANRVASRPATTLRDLVERLRREERRLSLLVAGDLSVETALSTSYDQLSEATATVFRALALVSGTTFDVNIAAAVAGATEDATEAALEDLTDGGLLEARDGGRYRMHDLIRVFAGTRQRAMESPDSIEESRRRLAYSLLRTLVGTSRGGLTQAPATWPGREFEIEHLATDAVARRWVLSESSHWWPAIQYAWDQDDYEAVLIAAEATDSRTGQWLEVGHWVELSDLALKSARAMSDDREVALRLCWRAWVAMNVLGDPVDGQATAAQALVIAEQSKDAYALARSHFIVAWCGLWAGTVADLEPHIEAALEGFESLGERGDLAEAMAASGALRRALGDPAGAVEVLQRALAVAGEWRQDEPMSVSIGRGIAAEELVNSLAQAGRGDEAVAFADVLVSLVEFESRLYHARARVMRTRALVAAGRAGEAARELEEVEHVLDEFPRHGQALLTAMHVTEVRASLADM